MSQREFPCSGFKSLPRLKRFESVLDPVCSSRASETLPVRRPTSAAASDRINNKLKARVLLRSELRVGSEPAANKPNGCRQRQISIRLPAAR